MRDIPRHELEYNYVRLEGRDSLNWRRVVYRLKRWQWILIAVTLPIYFALATFQVFGGFYLGFPPVTPAWLNNTRFPLNRTLTVTRATSLHLFGSLREGRITVKLEGVTVAEFVGSYDKRITLQPGTHELRLEMAEATGDFNYALE